MTVDNIHIVFGCTKGSDVPDDHVEDLWVNNEDDEYHAVKTSILEAHSKPSRPQNSFPDFPPDYRHGVTTSEFNEDAKQLIYANFDKMNEINEPGQQKRRNYNWPVDPESTTFGIKGETGANRGSSAGVAEVLRPLQEDDSTVFRTLNRAHDPTKTFGKSTSSANSSAAECLGNTKINSAQSNGSNIDAVDDIGKSLTPGFRNASTSRCFGCPSIRTDIPKYDKASVADTQNYGDDVKAGYLLRPSLFSSFGLEEDEFLKPRSKGFLRRLFRSCGLTNDNEKFEEIFNRVSDGNNFASIETFRAAFDILDTK